VRGQAVLLQEKAIEKRRTSDLDFHQFEVQGGKSSAEQKIQVGSEEGRKQKKERCSV